MMIGEMFKLKGGKIMKKFFSLLFPAAIIALSLSGCAKSDDEQDVQADGIKKTVTFNAVSPDTKSYFGEKTSSGYPTIWSTNTDVAIDLNMATTYNKATVIPTDGGRHASFSVDITDDGSGSYTFYALSPFSSVISITSERVNVELPQSQEPTNTSVDEKTQILAGKSATLSAWPAAGTVVPLSFQHLAAYGKFKLKNFPETVTISSITLEAEDYIAGRFFFYPATFTLDVNSASKTLVIQNTHISETAASSASSSTVSQAQNVVVSTNPANSDLNFWFAIRPVDMSGKTLKVSINTDAGIYVKNINFPADKGNFQRGKVATFNIDMDGITPEADKVYTKITKTSELLTNSQFIIVAADADYALATSGTNYRDQTSVTKNNTSDGESTIVNPSAAVQVFQIVKGSTDVENTAAFLCVNGDNAGKYIGASGSDNNLKSYSDIEGRTSFTIKTRKDSKDAYYSILKAHATDTKDRNVMRYNATSSRFCCYSPTSSVTGEVAIYKLNGSGEGSAVVIDYCDDPEISFEASTKTVTITCPTRGAIIGYTTDGSEPGVDPQTGGPAGTTQVYSEPFTITQTSTIKAFAGADHLEMSNVVSKLCEVGGNVPGTAENPYTATEAKEAALGGSTKEAYVKGIISSIAYAWTSANNNISFWISEDGTANTFEIYKTAASSSDDYKVGDYVVFKGNLSKYNTTPEMAEGSTLITQVKAPAFSPDGGIYTGAQTITLTADAGATIYYTTDGSTPTTSSSVYSSAIAVNTTTTIKAFAVKGEISTGIVSKTYTINAEANDGSAEKPYTASEAAQLALSGSTASNVHVKGIISSIAYAWTSASNNTSFWISEDGTANTFEIYKTAASSADDYKVGDYVVFKGTLTKYNTTPEMAEGSTLITQVKAPVFTPDGGNFTTSSQNVTLTADAGATIYYTTNGTTPTTSSSVYSAAINLTATTTIKAFAVKDGKATGIVSRTFTKQSSSSVTVTLTVGSNGNTTWTNSQKTSSATVGDVTFTALGGGGNDGKYYSSDNTWRFYASSEGSGVKITVPSGKKITSVVLTWKTGIPATPSGFTASGTTSPTTYVANSGTQVSEVSFIRGSANLLVQAITVTYE